MGKDHRGSGAKLYECVHDGRLANSDRCARSSTPFEQVEAWRNRRHLLEWNSLVCFSATSAANSQRRGPSCFEHLWSAHRRTRRVLFGGAFTGSSHDRSQPSDDDPWARNDFVSCADAPVRSGDLMDRVTSIDRSRSRWRGRQAALSLPSHPRSFIAKHYSE